MSEREATRFDRPIAEEYIDAATAYYAAPRELEDVVASSCFVFRVGAEWLAIPTRLLHEVVQVSATHSLPHRRGTVGVGLVSVRGDIIVYVSLAGLLGIADDKSASASALHRRAPRVVVLADTAGRIAISVDEILGFHSYDPAASRAVPSTLGQSLVSYATSMICIGDRIVGLLDGARVAASLSLALA
jgi:chemotaxis-related protein WspD